MTNTDTTIEIEPSYLYPDVWHTVACWDQQWHFFNTETIWNDDNTLCMVLPHLDPYLCGCRG